jgi:hypothetical protein
MPSEHRVCDCPSPRDLNAHYTDSVYEEGGEGVAPRLVRIEHSNSHGPTQYFEGGPGKEHLVRVKYTNSNTTLFFLGDKNDERLVRIQYNDVATFYEGQKGFERKVRVDMPNGCKVLYEGQQHFERMVRVECPNGSVKFYTGEKGAESIVH